MSVWVLLAAAALVVIGIVVAVMVARSGSPGRRALPPTPSGRADLEELACQRCGAELDRSSTTRQGGEVLVSCPYCGSEYRLVERN